MRIKLSQLLCRKTELIHPTPPCNSKCEKDLTFSEISKTVLNTICTITIRYVNLLVLNYTKKAIIKKVFQYPKSEH